MYDLDNRKMITGQNSHKYFTPASNTNLFTGDFYSAGWTYDDFSEYYQPEMSGLPLYGNIIRFSRKLDSLETYPAFNPGGPFSLKTDSALTAGRYRIKPVYSWKYGQAL